MEKRQSMGEESPNERLDTLLGNPLQMHIIQGDCLYAIKRIQGEKGMSCYRVRKKNRQTQQSWELVLDKNLNIQHRGDSLSELHKEVKRLLASIGVSIREKEPVDEFSGWVIEN